MPTLPDTGQHMSYSHSYQVINEHGLLVREYIRDYAKLTRTSMSTLNGPSIES